MTKLDQFESVFKASAKELFKHEEIALEKVLVVTDLDAGEAQRFAGRARSFLSALGEGAEWSTLSGAEVGSPEELLARIEAERPGLVCTYRNLHTSTWQQPYSLGEHLDVLTQIAPMPVLVLPHPRAGRASEHAMRDTDRVMVITDHLAGEHHLVSYGIRFTEAGGQLFLTHIEDEAAFERFMAAIAKIPEIDTEPAREELLERLLKDPRDYVHSCRAVLEAEGLPLKIDEHVEMGRRLATYRRLIDEHSIDLLVMNTKDEDQLAMHGLAWPLAIELRHIPLLLL